MHHILAIIGVITMLFSFSMFGMETPPQGAGMAFLIGIVLLLVGAIMANRNGRN